MLRVHPAPIANIDVDTLPIPQDVSVVSPSSLVASDKGKGKAAEPNDEAGRDGRIVKTKGRFLETVQSYDNIAPILDAVLADIDGSGQVLVPLWYCSTSILTTFHIATSHNLFWRSQYRLATGDSYRGRLSRAGSIRGAIWDYRCLAS